MNKCKYSILKAMAFSQFFELNLDGENDTSLSGYHADTPITIKAEPSIWPTAAFINIHEHPI